VNKHRIVIVGGGFGGVKAALELVEDERFHVTLISDHADFRIYGTLYHVSTGGPRKVSSIPLMEIFAGKRIHIIEDAVTGLDRDNRHVTTSNGVNVPYDGLVLALGVRTNYFHIDGLEKFSFGIKTPDDAEDLKRHIHKQLIVDQKPDANYVIVGGGPTGVELAGALPEYVRRVMQQHGLPERQVHVDIVEAAPRLLPRAPKDISRMVARHLRKIGISVHLKTAVQAQTADALMANNKPIRSHTVIWTAGVANNPFFAEQGFQLAKNGRVRTDQFLQAESGIYVLGDNADTPYSGMAQTALWDGKFVARNLIRLANEQEPKPYFAKKPIYVFPAGPRYAAVLWGQFRLYGFLGHILRSLADLVAFADYEPWTLATKRWLAEASDEESCALCEARSS
jgi:NADH dehydrogenase